MVPLIRTEERTSVFAQQISNHHHQQSHSDENLGPRKLSADLSGSMLEAMCQLKYESEDQANRIEQLTFENEELRAERGDLVSQLELAQDDCARRSELVSSLRAENAILRVAKQSGDAMVTKEHVSGQSPSSEAWLHMPGNGSGGKSRRSKERERGQMQKKQPLSSSSGVLRLDQLQKDARLTPPRGASQPAARREQPRNPGSQRVVVLEEVLLDARMQLGPTWVD